MQSTRFATEKDKMKWSLVRQRGGSRWKADLRGRRLPQLLLFLPSLRLPHSSYFSCVRSELLELHFERLQVLPSEISYIAFPKALKSVKCWEYNVFWNILAHIPEHSFTIPPNTLAIRRHKLLIPAVSNTVGAAAVLHSRKPHLRFEQTE